MLKFVSFFIRIMSHIDEKNFSVTLFDLLIHEYLLSCDCKKDTFVNIISPYLSNYPITMQWPAFLSNMVSISDLDFFQDLLKLIVQNNIKVKIITISIGRQFDFVKDSSRSRL